MYSLTPLVTVALLVLQPTAGNPLLPRDAKCPCGYKDSNGAIWRESFEADFNKNYNAAMQNFRAQTWGADHGYGYQMKYQASNVFPYNSGLGLRTQGYQRGQPVYTAEIDSVREDILYGSFRMKASVPTVPGVCFGFFTYFSDTQEQDIEFLSSDAQFSHTIHYTNQPGLLPTGNSDPKSYKELTVNADLTALHEHRFDWVKGATKFYLDGTLTNTFKKNVQTSASPLLANVWSDGGPNWTKGPPSQDAIATIHYIKAYFNSTSLNTNTFNTQCKAAGNPAPCTV